jgi:hypothetical protein
MVKKTNSNATKKAIKTATPATFGVDAPTDLDYFSIEVTAISQLAENIAMTIRPGIEYDAVDAVEAAVFRSIQDCGHSLFESVEPGSPISGRRFDHLNDWIKFLAQNKLDEDVLLSSLSVDALLYTLVAAKMQLTYLAGKLTNA